MGKMLALEAQKWDLQLWILDKSEDYPAASACSNFVKGDFTNFEDVYAFGKMVDILSIEIEHVNTEALLKLAQEGLTIHPNPEKLAIIQDKGLQKNFFVQKNLPTSKFSLWDSSEAIVRAVQSRQLRLPFVQKSRTSGYDGRGVEVIKTTDGLSRLLPGPSLTEDLVDIDKELAVIVSRNENGEVAAFPPVDMVFEPNANLVEFVRCPADISVNLAKDAVDLAIKTIEAFDISGLLAVEMFLTKNRQILINEVAPRPHNSGHLTLDNCYTSQFEQHLRAILNLSPGSTTIKSPAVMANILGAENFSGPAIYEGWEECLKLEGLKIHLYGKTITKPFRKMGHLTVLDRDVEMAMQKAIKAKQELRVIA